MVKDLCPELSQEGLGELPDEETELLLPNEGKWPDSERMEGRIVIVDDMTS